MRKPNEMVDAVDDQVEVDVDLGAAEVEVLIEEGRHAVDHERARDAAEIAKPTVPVSSSPASVTFTAVGSTGARTDGQGGPRHSEAEAEWLDRVDVEDSAKSSTSGVELSPSCAC